MNRDFAKVLNERGILHENTKIVAHYKGFTLDGTTINTKGELLVKRIDIDTFLIEATPLFGQNKYLVKIDDIEEIDGMSPQRLGKVFNINDDGTPRNTGKKRGRKPKNYAEV
jgi:hypothetical protein